MTDNTLPLFELFTRLRQADFPLGIDDYQLLLRALQAGFGLPDREALARLCRTLWVKSSDEARLFEYHFNQIMIEPAFSESVQNAPSSPQQKEQSPAQSPSTSESTMLRPISSSDLTLHMEDEIEAAQAVLQAGGDDEVAYSHFVRTDEYFPVTRRQMKQSWRYLRRPAREGPLEELDVEATVNSVARQGMLLEPVLVPRRTNRVELLLLLDQGGSMVPFHSLSHRLAETALRGGRLGKAGIYYFRNYPDEFLYHDPAHIEAELIEDILGRLHYGRSCALIFSDAGAARGGYNQERADQTKTFLYELKQRVRYVAWLNPVPQTRWRASTAGKIMQNVPMFDISRRGLDKAISVLRGRSVSQRYREG